MRSLTDYELAQNLGISLTELAHRREEHRRQVVEPAVEAFRTTLAEALIKQGRRNRRAGVNP